MAEKSKMRKITLTLMPEEIEILERLSERAGKEIRILLVDLAKTLVKQAAYDEYNLKFNFEAMWEAMLKGLLDGIKYEVEELRKDMDEIKRIVDDVMEGGVMELEGIDIDNTNLRGYVAGTDSRVIENIDVPERPVVAQSEERGRYEIDMDMLAKGYLEKMGEKEGGGDSEFLDILRGRSVVAEKPPASMVSRTPLQRVVPLREGDIAAQEGEMSESSQSQQPQKLRVYLDETQDPPFVQGISVRYDTGEFVMYEDGSIWSREGQKWVKVGFWLDKILRLEGRR